LYFPPPFLAGLLEESANYNKNTELLIPILELGVPKTALRITKFIFHNNKKSPGLRPQSASELYRPSDSGLLAKLVPTFADRG
jgi:hypothetical protein